MADTNGTINSLAYELDSMSLEDVQKKYRAVRIGGEGIQGFGLDINFDTAHPVDLFYAIERDPRVADAVQQIEWLPGDAYLEHDREQDWDAEWHGAPQSKSNLAQLQTHPMDMVDLGLTVEEKTQWRGEVDIGGHSATFAILLCRLPNLSSLDLTGYGFAYQDYLDKVFRQTSMQPHSPILSKLEKVSICHWDTEFGEQVNVIDELVLIPSLKKLECHMLGDDAPNDYQCLQTKNNDTRISYIQELEFTHSQLAPEDLAEILKPLVNLKKMDYEGQFEWAIAEDFQEKTMREEFDDAAGYMLEQRDMIWKMDADKLVIRKKDLAIEMEAFDEGNSGSMNMTSTVETMPDGTERRTTTFG